MCYTSKAVGPKAQNITQYTLTVPLKLKVDVRPAWGCQPNYECDP